MVIKVDYSVSPIYVNTDVSAIYIKVDYGTSGNGETIWGTITGTLSDQTDLQNALDDKVPYTGATGNVDLGEYELKAGQVEFDQSPTGTAGVGVMRWNDTDGTLDLGLKGGSVTLQVGEDIVARVVNKTGTNLLASNYQVVKVSSAQGQRLAVNFAQANNDNNSADTIGLVAENISNNQEGWIQILGQITEINTTGSLQGETWTDGDVLYLSPTTAGSLTNVKPVAPQHIVVLGYVEYAHSQHGKIYVKVMNGWELGELHDVDTTGATNGQALTYNSSLGIWQPSTISTNNIYNSNGTLTANRTLTSGGFNLTFTGSNTASGAIARGLLLNHTLVAAANNDVLVGLDVNPTFTNGAFTGVWNIGARAITSLNGEFDGFYLRNSSNSTAAQSRIKFHNDLTPNNTSGTNGGVIFYTSSTAASPYTSSFGFWNYLGGNIIFATNNSPRAVIFGSGNFAINNLTDAGFRLDVNGTSRFQDRVLISPTIATTNSILKLTDNTNGTTWAGFSTQTTTVGFFIGTNNALTIGRGTTADNTPPTGSQMNFRSSGVYLELTTNSANQGISFSDGNNATIRMNFPSSNEAALTTTTSQNLSIGTASNTSAAVTNTIKFFGSTNNVAIGSTTDNLAKLQVSGSITASSAIARGVNITPTLTAAANNDVLVGLDINPTFTNGAFTGVSNFAARVTGNSRFNGNITTTGNLPSTLSANQHYTFLGLAGVIQGVNQTNVTNLSIRTNSYFNGTNQVYIQNGRATSLYFDDDASLNYYIASSGTGGNTFTFTQLLKLFNTGNLLIQNGGSFTDAGFRLDVNGTARVQGQITSGRIVTSLLTYGVGIGNNALGGTITGGGNNVAVGDGAMSGSNSTNLVGNVAVGRNALRDATGTYNIAIGDQAMVNGNGFSGNIVIGDLSMTSGISGTSQFNNVTVIGRNIQTINANVGYSVALGSSTRITSSNQFVCGQAFDATNNGAIQEVYFGSGVQRNGTDNRAGVSYSINGSGALGTDFAGGNITIAGGKGTGTGTPGAVIFSTSTALTTGTTLQSLTERARIDTTSLTLANAINIVVGTTTGTKIGTATSQKIGFWNATPIVQPTTAIAEAAFVENSGGTAVNVDSTFAGYTLQQIAQALKDAGLLA